uniref:Type 1 phosphatases regulator YPI1 n=1 Tax=Coprinopsis cinerea (strain Okayama-7 / 130 / ATCC MYA-4618 / FGSC 9003) TaxID=240176 RepID=YPI1_COPC7|nr:RecName: Full=Type 1 phosphatases regulator YPI1 [Coprinopsis cinerea okayama7\
MSRTATAAGPSTSAPNDGSRTITITNVPTNEGGDDIIPEEDGPVGTLRLRAARTRTGPRVTWDEDVVDNEHAGKKKSKICCIFRPTRDFGESSSSDSDSDSSCDHDHDREEGPSGEGSSSNRPRQGPMQIHDCCDSDDDKNAYERLPSYQRKKIKAKRRAGRFSSLYESQDAHTL